MRFTKLKLALLKGVVKEAKVGHVKTGGLKAKFGPVKRGAQTI